eukprot:CAMPEP_0196143088 /NCGR_PEP_ID=MMETSP0910-20130528/12608_1 /TAXON_ID=49265 /ORGANISM="Thalassiosira rotula, Strain GSO102" /LENGTH=501 /DNA_ID=CAMNT_0041404481 /DNA_START=188 /DNA_END=1693 /DNA_ORIENTATION=+
MGEQTVPPSNFTKTLTEGLTFQLHLLHFVNVAFFTSSTLISLAIYTSITATIIYADGIQESAILEYLSASKASVGFFSGFLGFSLVFRTNICYNRWWEGRCLWGALIFASINLAQQGQCWIKDKQSLRRLCCAVVTFPYACKAQLRGASIMEDAEYLLQRGLINPAQLAVVTKRNGWQPYYFMGAMRAAINHDLEKSKAAGSIRNRNSLKTETTGSQILIFEESLTTLATSIGGLIRVKSTGLPSAYDLLFSIIFTIFFLIATIAWAPTLGWYTPIVIAVLRFTVKLIIVIGSELEDPFGDDVTDLPMQKFCEAIETQIEAIFEDAFPAESLCREWPKSVLDEASPEDIATPYGKPSMYLPELIDGSTAKSSFGPKGTRMRTSRYDEVDDDEDEIHSGDVGETEHMTSFTDSNSIEEEEETDEERRMYRKRKEKVIARKKRGESVSRKLAVSYGSDDTFAKKKSRSSSLPVRRGRGHPTDRRKKRVRNKQIGSDDETEASC